MVISNDLIRLSQAHATRHFMLLNDERDGNTPPLHLWLFLEFVQVAVVLPSSYPICGLDLPDAQAQSSSVSFSACKIMYREGTSSDSSTQDTSSAWARPDLVEQIQYPKEVCLQIRDLLRASSLCYPPSRRQFTTDWTVGFLQTTAQVSTL